MSENRSKQKVVLQMPSEVLRSGLVFEVLVKVVVCVASSACSILLNPLGLRHTCFLFFLF